MNRTPREIQVREECEHRKKVLWESPKRLHFINRAKDIVDYILPHAGPMLGERDSAAAEARWKNIFDTCATDALRIATAGLMTYAFPHGGEWRTLNLRGVSDPSQEVSDWLGKTDDVMEDLFAQSNVYQGIAMLARDTKAFGQGVAIVDFDELYTLWLYHVPVGDYAVASSPRRQIDTLYRELTMTLRSVVERWGEERLPEGLREKWKEGPKHWDMAVALVHAIEPRPSSYRQSSEAKGQGLPELNSEMEWRSVYWVRDSAKGDGLLSESGYPLFPVLSPREDVLPDDDYGYGSGCIALSHTRSLQHRHFSLGNLTAWQSDPMKVLPTAARGQPIGPGETIYIDTSNPHAVAAPVDASGKADLLLLEIQDIRRQIESAMGSDVFSMIGSLEGGNIRQEHILALKEEKFTILGPQTARFMDELPRPLIDIAFAWMQRKGNVPEMPQELLENGGVVDIELHGPLARASASAKKLANDSFLYGVVGLLEAFPEMRHKVKPFDAANVIHETSGADPSVIRSDEEAQRIADAEAKAKAEMQDVMLGAERAKSAAAVGSVKTNEPNLMTAALGVA